LKGHSYRHTYYFCYLSTNDDQCFFLTIHCYSKFLLIVKNQTNFIFWLCLFINLDSKKNYRYQFLDIKKYIYLSYDIYTDMSKYISTKKNNNQIDCDDLLLSVYINSTTRCLYEPEVTGIHELCFHTTPTMLSIGSCGSTGENRFLMRFWCSRRSIAMLLPFSTVCCHRLFLMFRGYVGYNRQYMFASCSSF
jgi:hypothetical protein